MASFKDIKIIRQFYTELFHRCGCRRTSGSYARKLGSFRLPYKDGQRWLTVSMPLTNATTGDFKTCVSVHFAAGLGVEEIANLLRTINAEALKLLETEYQGVQDNQALKELFTPAKANAQL